MMHWHHVPLAGVVVVAITVVVVLCVLLPLLALLGLDMWMQMHQQEVFRCVGSLCVYSGPDGIGLWWS